MNVQEIVAQACTRTASLVGGLHVLAIQDTTSLRDDGDKHSIQAHPTIAVDAENGALLGLVHADLLNRKGGRKAQHQVVRFDEKESRRWLDGTQASAGLVAAGAIGVTMVADAESDIYELFALKPNNVDLVVRAGQDRLLEQEDHLLFEHLAAQPEAGRFEIDLAATPGRRARRANLAVRFCRPSIKRPRRRPGSHMPDVPASLSMNLVEVREINPPEGTVPAHWRLLTTHAVDSFAKARWIAGLYRRRWLIEELFRTLKTRGFDIERVSIAEEPFEKLAAAAIIAAISVMQLVQERDGAANRPLADVFEPDEQDALEAVSKRLEGKTAKQKNPHPKGSLAYAAWVCARLGGWTGYYGKSGPVVMLRGLHQFRAMQLGWSLARNV